MEIQRGVQPASKPDAGWSGAEEVQMGFTAAV